MKHIAWDLGAIDEAMVAVLGSTVTSKTTKTLCDKRVKSSEIVKPDSPELDCLVCREEFEEEWQDFTSL